tara:strand:+ start:1331 stop:1681 length:351 start_codon:yes stop_codon:yes gene_type:complete
MKKKLIALATLIPLLAISSFPDAKAGTKIIGFNVDGNNWDVKIDTSGRNAGKLFLRKNGNSSKCKQYVAEKVTLTSFFECAAKKIGKKYVKQYLVPAIEREIPGTKPYIMAAYNEL